MNSNTAAVGATAASVVGLRFRIGTRVRQWLSEPLLQFLVIGALIFVVAHEIEHHRQTAQRQILVNDGVVSRLVKLHEMQIGSAPSPARLESLIEDYVHDEVLYREALQMGLDKDDEIVRRRLIQKLDFLKRDLDVVPEPEEVVLRSYYGAHAADFADAMQLSFRHLYFSPDIEGADRARHRAEEALQALRLQAPAPALELGSHYGDRFALSDGYVQLGPPELVQIFGQFPIVDGLQQAATGQWVGPLQSGYGWHLVYVTQRLESSVPPFEQVRDRVHAAWVDQQRQQANERSFEQLRRRYEVLRADRRARP